MARRGSRYTDLGRKVSDLSANQSELATVLELTQQSISGKLTGKIAVTLKDLEILCKHYNVPMLYFFTPHEVTLEMSRAWGKVLAGPPELHQTVAIASQFPEPFQKQLLRTVQAIRATSAYYTDAWMLDRDRGLAAVGGNGGNGNGAGVDHR
jgi:transcriptional regulator with XRE-family HTH domain